MRNRRPRYILPVLLVVLVLAVPLTYYFATQDEAESSVVDDTAGEENATPLSPESEAAPIVEVEFEDAAPPGTDLGLEESLSDAEWETLLTDLLSFSIPKNSQARSQLRQSRDPRAIAVFIELVRATRIGLVRGESLYYSMALEEMTGETFGTDWDAWVEWYGGTDLTPPPGFTAWKGRLLSMIDPAFGEFLADGVTSRIRTEEIQWGGVLLDGIPALDNPPRLRAAEATYLNPGDAVFGLEINGDARAYPLRIMDWHEMANDVVGGVPISLAYCTLCGAAIAYDGRASDGQTYTFGSSGFLYRSNKLMYDRQTRTLWNQLTGRPVVGELADRDIHLTVLPVVLTTWEAWQAQHPDTWVLDIVTGYDRPYRAGAAYADYFADTETMFPVWQRADTLDTKAQIFALTLDNIPKAYPLERVTAEGVINDILGETPLVVVAAGDIFDVQTDLQGDGPVRYAAGAEVRAYERGERSFTRGNSPDELVDNNGEVWQVTEDALVGPEGEQLSRLGGHLAYWFGWFAFYPQTLVYGE